MCLCLLSISFGRTRTDCISLSHSRLLTMTDARSFLETPVSLSSWSIKIFIIPFFFLTYTNPGKCENKMWPEKSHGYHDVSVFETFFLKCFPSTLKCKQHLSRAYSKSSVSMLGWTVGLAVRIELCCQVYLA